MLSAFISYLEVLAPLLIWKEKTGAKAIENMAIIAAGSLEKPH